MIRAVYCCILNRHMFASHTAVSQGQFAVTLTERNNFGRIQFVHSTRQWVCAIYKVKYKHANPTERIMSFQLHFLSS